MKQLKILALCLVAAFAVAVVASASASATEPAFYECVKDGTVGHFKGKYTDNQCSKEATAEEIREGKKNKFELQEWEVAKASKFKATNNGANLESAGVGGIACTGGSVSGKVSGPNTLGDVVVTFTGCALNSTECESAGHTAGTIVTEPLLGELGYLAGKGNKTPTVGVAFRGESSGLFEQFDCLPDVVATTGSLIAEISPVNVMTKEEKLTFKQGKSIGEQNWTKFEEGPVDQLTSHICPDACADPIEEGAPAAFAWETAFGDVVGEELILKA